MQDHAGPRGLPQQTPGLPRVRTGAGGGVSAAVIQVRVPVKLDSCNMHYQRTRAAMFAKAKRVKTIRNATAWAVRAVLAGDKRAPLEVTITRVSARRLDDDNLVAAGKPCADGVADALGVNDRAFVLFGDRPGIKLSYAQRSEGRGVFAVEVSLRFV